MSEPVTGVRWRDYTSGVLVTAICTALTWLMVGHFELSNLIMVYMLGVVVTAVRWGRGPSVLASLLAVAAFDFFFVPPRLSFAVSDVQYLVTLAVMMIVGLVIGHLTTRLRRQAQAAAEARMHVEAERLRNSLLAAISHDLRTPLAAIVGASSSLVEEEAVLGPEARRALGRDILESSHRMSELMDKVLDMARLQSGAIELNREWYPLEEIVGAALAQLKGRLRDHRMGVELPADLPWISVDARMLEQVLLNLIENAIKYSPAGTLILISAVRDGGFVSVEVADQGPGLPPGTEERVFDKFYQVYPEHAGAGAGLGLAICRTIVEAHGGTIRATSRADGGASFVFDLPVLGQPPTIGGEADE